MRTIVFSLRLTEDELAELAEQAKAEDRTVSQVVRRRLWPYDLTAHPDYTAVEEPDVITEVDITPAQEVTVGEAGPEVVKHAQTGRDALLAKINRPPRKK